MDVKTKLSQFFSNSSGNIAIISAVSVPVLLMVVGVAVSVSDAHNRKSTLQSHADNMSLTMAKKKSELEGQNVAAYFNLYMSKELRASETCTFEIESNPAQAMVNCSGDMPSFLSGVLDMKTVPYSVTSTAIMDTENIYEVAFVFDVSDSMRGDEIEDLKKSLLTISESALFDAQDSRLSLIPFANTVRLGDDFQRLVTPGSGFDDAGGVYNGCFDRDATNPNVDLRSNPRFSLVVNTISSGRVVCPHEEMTAVFHEEADDWVVKDVINNIETSFGTGLSDALVWGFRSLDPNLRGLMSPSLKYPLASNRSSKHIIMMTDGRPYDRPWSGPGGGAVTQRLSLERFEDVCSKLPFESKDISFHLINYNNRKLTNEHIEVFKGCVRGEGEFHDVQSGNLTSVISGIAGKISALRLSQ